MISNIGTQVDINISAKNVLPLLIISKLLLNFVAKKEFNQLGCTLRCDSLSKKMSSF